MITKEISKAFGKVGKSPFFRFVKRQEFIKYLEKKEIKNFPEDLEKPYKIVWELGEKSLEEEKKITDKTKKRLTRGESLFIFDSLIKAVEKDEIAFLLTSFNKKKYVINE